MNNSRNNILCWYPFRENSKILEIYQEESCLPGARSIRLQDLEQIEDKYDYIVLNGVIRFMDGDVLLQTVKGMLEQNGHILIMTENKLGIRYLSGFQDEFIHRPYASLNGLSEHPALSRKQLQQLLASLNLKNQHFYYPYPDYRNAGEIFTDASVDRIEPSAIDNSLIDDNILIFDSDILRDEVFANGLGRDLANAFLIDVSDDDVDHGIDYLKISSNRRDEFKLYTQLDYDHGRVYKKALGSPEHLKRIADNDWRIGRFETLRYSFRDGYLECELLKGKTLSEAVSEDITLLEVFKNELIQGEYRRQEKDDRFIEVFGPETVETQLHWLDKANIDMLLDNIFIKDDRWIIIDPEWVFAFPIPAEFVLYRALKDTPYKDRLDLDEETVRVFELWDKHFVYDHVGTQIVDYKIKRLVYLDELYAKSLETDRLLGIENSTIWRASAPLRNVMDKFKK